MTGNEKDPIVYHPRRRKPRGRGRTCIDVFAGAGGLAEGFRSAGWRIVSATDGDPYAAQTFRGNFSEAAFFEGPITHLRPSALLQDAGLERGELDCLLGGPPCQAFSYNNHQRSASDERARLFRYYLRLVRALWPKTLVMENVPGMLTISGGEVLKAIMDALERIGYVAKARILFAEDYGVPQRRRRVFIVATRLRWEDSLFPSGTHGPSTKPSHQANPYVHRWEPRRDRRAQPFTTVWDAISDLPVLNNGQSLDGVDYRCPPSSDYQRMLRHGSEAVYNHLAHALTEKMAERIRHVPEGGNWRDIPYELLPAGMQRAKTKDHTTRYGRLDRQGLAWTILTKCDPHWGCYIHPLETRTISVREAARLQSFPDRFRFFGPHSQQYIQVGNAVPPLVAAAVARAVRLHLTRVDQAQLDPVEAAA